MLIKLELSSGSKKPGSLEPYTRVACTSIDDDRPQTRAVVLLMLQRSDSIATTTTTAATTTTTAATTTTTATTATFQVFLEIDGIFREIFSRGFLRFAFVEIQKDFESKIFGIFRAQ